VTTVSPGTDDTEETTAMVGVLRTTTACQRVVSQQLCFRVVEPREQDAASPMLQDPSMAAILLEESEHI
jgi:hypothetical protein